MPIKKYVLHLKNKTEQEQEIRITKEMWSHQKIYLKSKI